MLVYLAAPYTHKDPNVIEERMRQFYAVDAHLISQGIFTVSPLLKDPIVQQYDIPGTWDYWKNYSHALLSVCNKMIVITIDGWEESVGVQAEIEIATNLNIPIEYMSPDVVEMEECEHAVNFMSPDDIVRHEISVLAPADRWYIRDRTANNVISLHPTYGMHIRNTYHLWHPENPYTTLVGKHADDVSFEIVKRVWETFQ